MICVAANNKESLENVTTWMNEIKEIEPTKPIVIILTKSDLVDMLDEDEVVDDAQIKAKMKECGFADSAVTSAK